MPAASRAAEERARAAQTARIESWRRMPDLISAPGVDWSPTAARRRGWRPDMNFARGTPGRTGAEPAHMTAGPPETLRVAILRIDFQDDRGGNASTGDGHFDLSGPNAADAPFDPPPRNRTFYLQHLEALRRYYDAQSYGRVVVVGDVWPRSQNGAYSVSDMADFGPWTFGQGIYGAAVHMFRTFVTAADSQSIVLGDRIPWDQVDRIVLLHAGSDLQSDVRQDSKEDIPSFTIGVAEEDTLVLRDISTPGDSVVVDRASLIPETANQDGYYGTINGVLAHECGHLFFGFADLYNTETGFPVVGFWSLMDSGNLVGTPVLTSSGEELFATGLLPPSIDPFQRFYATDALDFGELAGGDTVTIACGERSPDMRKVRLSSDEYLLLENRWLAPSQFVELDQDTLTGVILGPLKPDRFEYDALLWGPGLLIWHIDESVIPFTNSLRVNPDFGFNTNPLRLGISVVEADGLADLGDPGSVGMLGAYRDPWFVGNVTSLSDSSRPPLVAHTGALPHLRLDVLDPADSLMRVALSRRWRLPAWPVAASFPPGGPQLLAVDADGDRKLEVCWAGGDSATGDSTALFALRVNGEGLFGTNPVFATLDRRPRPVMAALPVGGTLDDQGPAYFAVSTYADGPTTATPGGQVWLVDYTGTPLPGWPPALPSIVTTPPVIAGQYPTANVFVGCADGRVYALDLNGTVRGSTSAVLGGGVRGRLAVADRVTEWSVAAGGTNGDVAVYSIPQGSGAAAFTTRTGWPVSARATTSFEPDFLWLDFDGAGGSTTNPSGCGAGAPELVVHDRDWLGAYCESGITLAGWPRAYRDTLVTGLGAADPDGDGFPEVLTQSYGSLVSFVNVTGHPSPGWPRRGSKEGVLVEDPYLTYPDEPRSFPSQSPPLALDITGDRRARVITQNTSGLLVALDGSGAAPAGWPLASGSGAAGAPLAADLDRDGTLDLVAPDRSGLLYAYRLPGSSADPARNPWPMLGGDAGRTSSLPSDRAPIAPAPAAGPYVTGSLKAYPNPARRKPVTFAWKLSEPAQVEFRILDTSGHEVASFARNGIQSDNIAVWDPGALPSGLYLARVRFRGSGSERVEIVPVGLLR